MNRNAVLALGIAATALSTFLWHGPLGAGDRFAQRAEARAKLTLVSYDLPAITARMERGPLRRTMILSGPATDFQRTELVRMMDNIPGILDARWDPASPVLSYEAAK
jgi:hypothetical protein